MPVYARMLDVESEMGELAKEYLKATNYGANSFELTSNFKEEFGGVLYALISLDCELKIDCEESLELVLSKMSDRMKKNNAFGSGR